MSLLFAILISLVQTVLGGLSILVQVVWGIMRADLPFALSTTIPSMSLIYTVVTYWEGEMKKKLFKVMI